MDVHFLVKINSFVLYLKVGVILLCLSDWNLKYLTSWELLRSSEVAYTMSEEAEFILNKKKKIHGWCWFWSEKKERARNKYRAVQAG